MTTTTHQFETLYNNIPDQHQAKGLLGMVRGFLIAALIGIPFQFVDRINDPLWTIAGIGVEWNRLAYAVIVLTSLLGFLTVSVFLKRGQLGTASRVFVAQTLLIATLGYLPTAPTGPVLVAFSLPLVAAGVLLNQRGLQVVLVMMSTIILSNILVLQVGTSNLNPEEAAAYTMLIMVVNMIMLRVFASGRLVLLEERLKLLDELEAFNRLLEQRVAARTRDLMLAAEVSREASVEMNPDVLLPRVVDLTREAFDLYHVGIFLYDETEEMLTLAAGTGDAGLHMQRINKRFLLNSSKGLVSKAARQQKPLVINNVADSEDHSRNPILPDTQSEIALPMLVSGKLIGVMNLQSTQLDRFSTDDLRVLQTLAERLAVSVNNARLFAETKQAREKAEEADKVKSMFLASMSHELRTPLNAIINFSKFVVRGVMGPVNEKQVETLTNVINSAEHLLSLINDVLDISKIESGSLSLYVEENVHIADIVATVQKTAETLLEDKPVTLRTDIQADLPLLAIDQQRIMQVLLNIVSNACKFTKEGEISILARYEDAAICVAVSDTGPGIAPADHESVFEKFKQTNTGLRQGSGTGLGMPISKRLVEAHGGQMWIESEEGEGATFIFTLPAQPQIVAQPA